MKSKVNIEVIESPRSDERTTIVVDGSKFVSEQSSYSAQKAARNLKQALTSNQGPSLVFNR